MGTLSADIQSYITNAANQYGVSPDYMSTLAQIESGGNPNAQSSLSSARGLFQFTQSTGAQYGLQNPFDPQQSSNAAAQLTRSNSQYLSRLLGLQPEDWQLYLAHQQGAGGAGALLTADSGANAVQTLQNAGVSSSTAYKSIVNNLGKDFTGDPANVTVGDFLGYWKNKYNTAAGGTGTSAGAIGVDGSGAATSGDKISITGVGLIDDVLNWIIGMASRVSVFVLGAIFILGGLLLFNGSGAAVASVAAQRVVPIRVKAVKQKRVIKPRAVPQKKEVPADDPGEGLGEFGREKVRRAQVVSIVNARKLKAAK